MHADQNTGTFTATGASGVNGSATLTASLASAMFTSTLTFCRTWNPCSPSQIVISQVYGGGGNSGSTVENDFIELFNRGATAVNIGGWEVWYASSTGSFSSGNSTAMIAGTIPAGGKYLLIGEAKGAGGTVALAPDVTGSIALGAGGGKVALTNSSTARPREPAARAAPRLLRPASSTTSARAARTARRDRRARSAPRSRR